MHIKKQVKKQMLIVTGPGNSGKSSSVKLAYNKILQRAISRNGPTDARFLYLTPIEVGVSIRTGSLLGIATRGDSELHVLEGLNFFLAQGCSLIVCATRSRGESLDAAVDFAQRNGFLVTRFIKDRLAAHSQRLAANKHFSEEIVEWAIP